MSKTLILGVTIVCCLGTGGTFVDDSFIVEIEVFRIGSRALMGGQARKKAYELVTAAWAAVFLAAECSQNVRPHASAVVAFRPVRQIEVEAARTLRPFPASEKPNIRPEPLTAAGAAKRIDANHHADHFGGIRAARTAHGPCATLGTTQRRFAFAHTTATALLFIV
jgi:hypothetical protein